MNDLIAQVETLIARERTWGGLCIQTDPPSYMDWEMDDLAPHLARAVRFEVMYEHVRTDPYQQV